MTILPLSCGNAEDRHAIDHAAEVRRVLARFPLPCGCESPRVHEPGCAVGLDAESRARLAAELGRDPFPRPRLTPDDELALVARVRVDREYAEMVLARFVELFGGTP